MSGATGFPVNACFSPDCVRSATRTASKRLVRPSWRAIALSAAISLVAHLSALAALAPSQSVEIAGGAPATIAALGNSFADFTQGATPVQPAAAPTSTVDPAVTPETVTQSAPPVQPTSTAQSPQPETLAMAVPEASERAVPDAPPLTAPEAADPVVALAIDPEAPRPEIIAPTLSAVAPTDRPLTEPSRVTPVQPQAPVVQAAPSPPPAAVTPEPEVTVQQADANTPRAPRRPEPRQERAQPQAQPQPQTQRAQAAPSAPQAAGNSDQDARRGSADGTASASAAAASGAGGAAAQAGNAAVSNYPGQVMERIRRTRQQRVSGRGVAVVSFSVNDSGALAAASVQRSSGSAVIDAAALDHIRRAGPFPAPPAGAGRSFSFEFVVR
ncbi:energy transducer TonB family protein [Pararhodobacter sp.]|uniref:energy transducer TonB family protein n=1 Tax=Pararhodobacter sp. TaxID=2127056 RepID=UPI002FDDF246